MRIPKAGIKTIDRASFATLLITLTLFAISLAEKGLTQEILLEAAVFLVSIKLVLASHKIDLRIKSVEEKLNLMFDRYPAHSEQKKTDRLKDEAA